MEGKLNIVLVEYINRNLGDTVISECAKFLLQLALSNEGITNYQIHEYSMYLEDMEYIKNADLIIFAGGGFIKFKREKFYKFLPRIINTAQENNIPVFLNCMGVEDFDKDDERCMNLARALNSSCIKGITVRDDFDTLRNKYIIKKKDWIEKVLDPAAFSADVYKCGSNGNSNVIGLGICRRGLFVDYDHYEITEEFIRNFWMQITQEVEKIGYQWQFFCNGLYEDYCFALSILEDLGINRNVDDYICRRPTEGHELVEIISGYKAIIAPRLHANIIAYSVGVPSIGLVWNDKLKQWGSSIGCPERFLDATDISPEKVIFLLKNAILEGCKSFGNSEKEKITRTLGAFVKSYGRTQKSVEKQKAYQIILIANAMGGKNQQFNKMNSPETFLEKYLNGFRWFEIDLQITCDGKIVCVNGWGKQTLNRLGYKYDVSPTDGMLYAEFMQRKYYDGHYPVMDLEYMIRMLSSYNDVKIIFDVRGLSTEKNIRIISAIIECIRGGELKVDKVVFRVSSDAEVNHIKMETSDFTDQMVTPEIMYDAPASECNPTSVDICSDPAVDYISLRKNICNDVMIENYSKFGKKLCMFTANKLQDIQYCIKHNIMLVATDYLDIKNMDLL